MSPPQHRDSEKNTCIAASAHTCAHAAAVHRHQRYSVHQRSVLGRIAALRTRCGLRLQMMRAQSVCVCVSPRQYVRQIAEPCKNRLRVRHAVWGVDLEGRKPQGTMYYTAA